MSESGVPDLLPALPTGHVAVTAARRLLAGLDPAGEGHALQVARLALAVFDGLRGGYDLDEQTRLELTCAALLHDVGVRVIRPGLRQAAHHKAARDLILERLWVLPQPARWRTALMARYHRKALPHPDHRGFRDLDAAQQRLVWAGAACLRLADGLDRTHRSLAREVRVQFAAGSVQIAVEFLLAGQEETVAATRKADALARFTGRAVIVVPCDVGGFLARTGTHG